MTQKIFLYRNTLRYPDKKASLCNKWLKQKQVKLKRKTRLFRRYNRRFYYKHKYLKQIKRSRSRYPSTHRKIKQITKSRKNTRSFFKYAYSRRMIKY